ncbi:MAG: hypothetical protein H7343_00250 [Undibacterium sp.]|nr:hypothetical protein [Opitutaceae bacterium]
MFSCSSRFLLCLAACLPAAARAQSEPDYERPPIRYSATAPHDAVTRLQARLADGSVKLAGSELEMLGTVLAELGVPADSQMLVFSRTSFQRTRIHPDRPRALYFSDTVYVGWVPGGLVEVTAIDPHLGPVFYTLTLPRTRRAVPQFERESDCLRCHGGTFVREIPGLFVRSVFPDAAGDPLLRHGTQLVDDETPFAERWGGWYVTGYHGTGPHRGNTFGSERGDQLVFTPSPARPDELSAFFETSAYLRPTSDVLALLISEHQMSVQNSFTHAGFAVRRIIAYQHGLQKAFKEPQTDEPAYDSVRSVYAGAVQAVVDRLLFRDAAPLPAGITGDATFRAIFAADAPRTRAGDSLRDLQLGERLFAHRCSYLIYSDSFRALPSRLQHAILDRLDSALRSRDSADRYAYLPAEEKARIHAILLETHPAARARWNRLRPAASAP